jgi:tRNA uridine 5-carboxymethylaminomethyl modification enzyme
MSEALGIDLTEETTLHKLLKRHDLTAELLERYAPLAFAELSGDEKRVLESRIKYEGYVRREEERLARLRQFESRSIPAEFDYGALPGISREVAERCASRRPRTVGEAARIPGVTPAAVAIISAHVARGSSLPA